MAAALYLNTCVLHRLHSLHVDSGRSKQCLTKSLAQLVIIGIQALFCHIEYFSHQRKTIGMYTGGSDAHQYITGLDILTGDQVFTFYHAYGKSCQIILILGHQSGMFCGLTAYQCCVRLLTALCHALYDSSDLLGNIASACDIIQEK